MKRVLNHLMLCLLLVIHCGELSAADLSDLNSTDIQYFRAQMQQELAKAQERVNQALQRASSTQYVPAYIDKVALENAITMLDVKTSLFNNFTNNPVIISPQVRILLISILQKEMITPGDLAALQSASDQERARQAQILQQSQQSTQPAPQLQPSVQ